MTGDEARDEFAAMRATIDQAVASLAEMARVFGGYYLALVKEGVPPERAATMAAAFQTWQLNNGDEQ